MKAPSPATVLQRIASGQIMRNAMIGGDMLTNRDESRRKKWKPGEYYQSLPEDDREILKELKSDDARKLRVF